MPIDQRPETPSPELLDRARQALARRLSLDPGSVRWKVGERMDRKRSTLFHLTLVSASSEAAATAYYKTPYFPPEEQDSRHLDRAREALVRSETLGSRFMELAGDSPISINVTIAFDEETLEVVTLGLEGEPMGNPLRFAFTGSGRRRAVDASAAVGEAIRFVESLPGPDPGPDVDRIWEETERKLESVRPLLSEADRHRLGKRMGDLFQAATEGPSAVTLAHGDLSPGNVILMEEGIGLIDFMWIPQLKGFDLSRFIHRLRYTGLSFRPWTNALIEAVIDGYGDPDAPSRPGWRFSELQRLLATIQRLERRGEGGRRSAGRALDEIRTGL